MSFLRYYLDTVLIFIHVLAANAAPLLVTELSYPPYRGPLTSAYNSLWYTGAIMYAISSTVLRFWLNLSTVPLGLLMVHSR